MKIDCPNCGQHYDVDDDYVGETVECETCGSSFIVKQQTRDSLVQGDILPQKEVCSVMEQPLPETERVSSFESVQPAANMPFTAPSIKPLVCEMCGGADLLKDNGVFVCQSCGTKYSLEEAKRMMITGTVSVTGTVKVDMSEKLENLYKIARRAKEQDNSLQAAKYYDLILQEDANSWEANFYTVYFKAMESSIADIWKDTRTLKNAVRNIPSMIREEIVNDLERKNAYHEISTRIINIGNAFFTSSRNYFSSIIRYSGGGLLDTLQELAESQQDKRKYHADVTEIAEMCYVLGDALESNYRQGDRFVYPSTFINLWKFGTQILGNCAVLPEIQQRYTVKVMRYSPNYTPPSKSGCYIATAVYGAYDCPEVWTLRRFRDKTLAPTWYGRMFIYLYYMISPNLIRMFGTSITFKRFWRCWLDKLVRKLQSKGFESSPYRDLHQDS